MTIDPADVLTGWSLIDETDGYAVDNDMHDDPILVGPDGRPVTTWNAATDTGSRRYGPRARVSRQCRATDRAAR